MCKSQEHFDPVPHNSDHRGTGHVDIYIEIRKGDLAMLFSEDESAAGNLGTRAIGSWADDEQSWNMSYWRLGGRACQQVLRAKHLLTMSV